MVLSRSAANSAQAGRPLGIASVKEYGVVGDGVADDTVAIQNAITANEEVYFPDGNYKIAGTLYVISPSSETYGGVALRYRGKTLRFSPRARIIPTTDADVLVVRGNGNTIIGGILDLCSVGLAFTHSALVIEALTNAAGACESNLIDGIKIAQLNGALVGTGILLKADGTSFIYRNIITNFEVHNFYYGLRFADTGNMGINGNVFSNGAFWANQQLMYVDGGGNTFSFVGQATTADAGAPELACIYVEGSYNTFDGLVWDVGAPQVKYAFEFGTGGYKNTILTAYRPEQVLNPNNLRNYFAAEVTGDSSANPTQYVLPHIPGTAVWNDFADSSGHDIPSRSLNMISCLNNVLGRKEIVTGVTVTSSNMKFSGIGNPNFDNFRNLFDHHKINCGSSGYMLFTATDAAAEASMTITLDFASDTNQAFMLDSVGLLFGANSYAGTGTGVTIAVTAITAAHVEFPLTLFGGTTPSPQYNNARLFKNTATASSYLSDPVAHLRIVLTGAAGSLPSASWSSLLYVYANAVDWYGSGSSVPFIGGDTFSGDIEFHDRAAAGVVLKSPDASRWRIMVGNDGALTATKL